MSDIDEWLRQAQVDTARMEAQNAAFKAEQLWFQLWMDTFQAQWALHCAEMHVLMLRGMFDPTFCRPSTIDRPGDG